MSKRKDENLVEPQKILRDPRAKVKNRKAQSAEKFSGVMVLYMFATILTKILGFGREIFITQRFGYGAISDGYILGFSIPDLVYSLLVGGAITAAITPILSAAIERDEEEEAWRPISTFLTLIFVFFALFMILGEIFAGPLVSFINPGKDPFVIDIASSVSRVIFLQTFFFILIAILAAVLSANKVFGLQVFGDSIYNFISLISIAFLGVATKDGAVRVAWGIVVAALAYFLYIAFFAKPYVGNFRPNLDVKQPLFKRILFLAVPPIISGSVMQITVIIRQTFADQFVGAITSLRNAATLYNLPYQIAINSIGPLMLPNIAGFLARGANKEASIFFSKSVKTAIYILVPASILFFVASEETVQAVYQWNVQAYTHENVRATAGLLRIYAIDMLIQTLVFFINQTFYAKQKSWIALVTAVITMGLNPILFYFVINVLNQSLLGLAWASVISGFIIFLISYVLMKRNVPEIRVIHMPQYLVKVAASGVFAVGFLALAKLLMPSSPSKIIQLMQYAFYGVVIFGTYFLGTIALDMPEARSWLNIVQRVAGRVKRRK